MNTVIINILLSRVKCVTILFNFDEFVKRVYTLNIPIINYLNCRTFITGKIQPDTR